VIIPKEDLVSFQRWQAGSFDKRPAPAPKPAPVAAAEEPVVPVTEQPETTPPIALPTAEDIERVYEEARASGYQAGLAEGKAAGEQTANEALALQASRLNTLISGLQTALNEFDQSVAEQMLALSIEIAAQLARGVFAAQNDALLPIIREALAALPLHHAHIVIRLNPADGDIIRTLLGEEFAQTGTQILDDSEISLGGCLLQAGSSEVDATIETRWKRVLEAIGTEPQAWLNP
jgi:flagellar assembly protein FliH